MFFIPSFVVFLRQLQPARHKVYVLLRCRLSRFRLLLESVQDIDGISKFHRLDTSVSIGVKVFNHL